MNTVSSQEQISSDFDLMYNAKLLFLWIILVPNIPIYMRKIWYVDVGFVSTLHMLHSCCCELLSPQYVFITINSCGMF